MHFPDTAKTMITLCNKDLKMFGLETNFESTRPIPHYVETKTKIISLSSIPRPRLEKIGLETETGLETYITGPYNQENFGGNNNKRQTLLYSRSYCTLSSNEWRDPSPQIRTWAMQKRRSDASLQRQCPI